MGDCWSCLAKYCCCCCLRARMGDCCSCLARYCCYSCCRNDRRTDYQSHINPSQLEERARYFQGESERLRNERNAAKARMRQLEEDLAAVRRERDDALDRLSAALAARLVLNNPNIADLSDVNRPTELGKRYSELYDNQWTDAHGSLTENGLDDNSAIKILLNILIMIYNICSKDAQSQIDALSNFGVKDLSPEVMKTLVDKRKGNYKDYIAAKREDAKNSVYKEVKNCRRSNAMDKYMDLCFELCWLMSIQDPPMIIDTQTGIHGSKFRKDYRAFTSSGPLLDFVVLPALYLHKGGPTVLKGIAQGMADNGDKSDPGV